MPRDDDPSLGDEVTLQGGKPTPADERSLGDRSTFAGSEGSSLSDLGEFTDLPDHDMEIVALSSRYTIEKTLGKGGMGEVLLATDTRLDRKVAIKRIRGDAGSSKAAVARFLTEAKSIAALSHNNVVQVYDYGRDQEGPFLIMEYVAGGSLLDRCKEGPIELEEAVDLACQLCDGLGRAHDAGIIHRDIKPANILLTDDGVPKLTDFGLAKADSRDHTMTMAGAVLGTLDFMPPEQRQDSALVDARSDLWSLAATLYQMVTGESPKVIRIKKVPALLQDLIDKALEEAKEDRYQSAQELSNALAETRSNSQSVAPSNQDLGAGECPQCHTLNESSRKFCRECAAPLLVPCLQCSEPMAIWDKVCGECGGKQQALLEDRNAQHASQREEAERLRADYQFSEAIDLLKPMQSFEDQRFSAISEWAKNFGSEIEEEAERRPREAQESFAESQKHRDAFDYPAAITSLQQIPAPFLTTNMARYLRDMEAAESEAKDVLAQIKQAINADDLDELLPIVERGIELRGDRKDLPILRTQLLRRIAKRQQLKKTAINEAKKLLDSQKYEKVIGVLSGVPEKLIDKDIRQLQSLAESKLRELRALEDEIESKQDDDTADPGELIRALKSYLLLQRHDTVKRESLRLAEEAVQSKTTTVSSAKKLIDTQEYEQAIGALADVPPQHVDDEVMELVALAESKLNTLRVLGDEIGTMQSDGDADFDVLTGLLNSYLELKHDSAPMRQLLDNLVAERDALIAHDERLLEKAGEKHEAQDYTGALAKLDEISFSGLKSRADACIESVNADLNRIHELDGQIENALTVRELDRLKLLLDEYLSLRQEDKNREQLRDDLIAVSEADDYFYLLNYSAALAKIQTIQTEALQNHCSELKGKIESAASRVADLLVEIREADANQQHDGLLVVVKQYLELNPSDVEILGVQERLVKREEYRELNERFHAADVAAKERARKQRIIASAVVAGIVLILTVTFYLRAQGIASDISDALGSGDFATVLELEPDNTKALAMKKEAEDAQNAEDLATALTSRDYRRALQVDPRNAEALSMKKAADIQQALLDGDYAAALQLDPSNVEAVSMRKVAAEVQQALSDGDYVNALQLDPKNAEALSMKKAAEIQQALSDGDYAAALELDPSSTEALVMKKKAADIQQALWDGDYAAALQIDPSNAVALSMKKKAADIQQALSDGDYAAALQLDPNNAQARDALLSLPPSLLSDLPPSVLLNLPPITNSIGMKLKLLPPGTFMMGDANGESNETPHEVTLTQSLKMSVYEVTQSQYEQVMGKNPSKFKSGIYPVDSVSWHDAVDFCRKLSELPAEKAAGRVYRLPTEAEWEYACRAGTTTKYSFGDDDSDLWKYGWHTEFAGRETHPVGGKQPNPWGLYDMHGNVGEWCQDRHGAYPSGSVTDPGGVGTGSLRVRRGGRWGFSDGSCRSAYRYGSNPSRRLDDYGFRVCLSPSGK